MNYSKEQLFQIDKVKSVFNEFITNSPDIDLTWSDKIGYIFYNGICPSTGDFLAEPVIIKDAAMLCSQLLYEIAFSELQSFLDFRDLHECSSVERALIEKACAPYVDSRHPQPCSQGIRKGTTTDFSAIAP